MEDFDPKYKAVGADEPLGEKALRDAAADLQVERITNPHDFAEGIVTAQADDRGRLLRYAADRLAHPGETDAELLALLGSLQETLSMHIASFEKYQTMKTHGLMEISIPEKQEEGDEWKSNFPPDERPQVKRMVPYTDILPGKSLETFDTVKRTFVETDQKYADLMDRIKESFPEEFKKLEAVLESENTTN